MRRRRASAMRATQGLEQYYKNDSGERRPCLLKEFQVREFFAGNTEVVAFFFGSGGGFRGDGGGVDAVYSVEKGAVCEEVSGDEDARAGEEGVVPFVLQGGDGRGRGGGQVVDGDV